MSGVAQVADSTPNSQYRNRNDRLGPPDNYVISADPVRDPDAVTARRLHLPPGPDLQPQLQPKTTGWMAHESPFAFATDLKYAPDIRRFLHGSPAIPALYAAQSGYRIINEIGVDKIRTKSVRQTERLIELAEEAGFRVTSPKQSGDRGGTITIGHEAAAAITSELIRREFIVDYRPGAGVRISPHFYTSDEEIELVVREMKEIRDTRAYAAHETAGAAF